jgi:hypothetical protein
MAIMRLLALDHDDPGSMVVDNGINFDSAGTIYMVYNETSMAYEDPLRVMTHPSFAEESGVGIYTYDSNPDETHNFHIVPARRVETIVQKTISSSILVRQPENDEDVIVTEIWTGGGNKLSILADQYRTFYNFWVTIPEVGEYIVWEPKDITTDTYQIEIVDVQLGGTETNYFERRATIGSREGAYVTQTLSVKFKIVRSETLPTGSITLAGL